MKKVGEGTFVLLLFAFLLSSQLSVNASNNMLPKAQGISLSSEFTDKLKTLQPNDVIHVWVDIEAWVDRFNDTYLPADPALYGIRWIMITFAPGVKQNNMFWVLAEVDVGKVQEISKIPWVKNITLIETGEYVEPSSNPKIVGGLHCAVQRAMCEGNKSIQVIVYVEDQTTQIQRDAILENITALINQLGGEVLKTGSYKNKLVAQIPPQVIENITDNSYVSSIYSRGPVVFCREALSNKQNTEQAFYCFANDLAIKLGCFVVLGLIIDFPTADRKARRRRLTLYVTVILSTVFLSTLPSAQALDISTATIRATNVWDAGNRGSGVNVAVIDNGIDFNHPDFPPEAIRASWNIPNNNATLAQDTWGHGTHVAGIIAGRGVNNTLYRGVAWEADLIVVRIIFDEDLEDAVRWIIDNKDQYNIRIISSSASPSNVPPGGDGRDSPYAIALDDAVDAGIVVIQAAGNHGPDPQTIDSPGNAFNVITVGAINDQNTQDISDDILAGFSSRGPTGDGRTKPDVVAPGVRIISCRAAGTDIRVQGWDTYIDDNYVECTGTSMAAPHVAGVAALILQAHPTWTPQMVKNAIKESAIINDQHTNCYCNKCHIILPQFKHTN